MKISHRITALVVLAFAAIVAIGGYSIQQSRSNASEVKRVTEGVVPSSLASADLLSQLKDVQLATINVVTAPDTAVAKQAKETLQAHKTRLQESIELQLTQADSEAQRGLVEQTKESLGNYLSSVDDAANLKMAGQKAMAEASLAATVAQYLKEMEGTTETLRIEKNRSKDDAITKLNESLSGAVTAIASVTLLALFVIGGFGFVLYRQITRPISQMQSMMTEIATSQDFTRRVPVEQMDEIGHSIVAFNAMIAKIQESSELLRQKTNDIQTMLQNMPQGILTITDGNKIHPEYSAYLETIFETKEIADRGLMELVFANTNLGADILSQIEAVGGACIGEDLMNFEFNSHLMVGEVEKTMADGRVKILDLNWSPITDGAETTVRLMLCVRDVTELRKLAAEANEQKRELEIIGEILAVSQEKFHEFIAGSIKFVDENEQLIRENPDQSSHVIAHLFRNMHTIKGNARTYGLQHLTNIVHEAEQTYDDLRQPYPDIAWDQASLMSELAGVRDAVERYARINEVSLGRKGPGRRGGVERYLMVDKAQIVETLHRLETVNTANLHELVAARDAVRKTLRLLGTETLSELMSGVLESIPSLAEELGKPVPKIEIEDNGYVVRNQASALLKNVFVHLVRNSMDHGLEVPAIRQLQNKPAAGTIRLQTKADEGMFKISISDDGRGLALASIRRIAIEKKLIEADAVLTDEQIAQQIFRAGFSTAETITEVSGRGVGMDAAQEFIRRENGRLELHFLDSAVGADFRRFEIQVCIPESFAEHVDGKELRLSRETSGGKVRAGENLFGEDAVDGSPAPHLVAV